MLSYLSKFHKKSYFTTLLKNQDGKISNYYIGIGILVVIIIIAVGAVVLFPDIRNSITPSSQSGESKTKSRLAGGIIDINQEGEYFTIEEEGTGDKYKINLPEGSEIKAGGLGSGTYQLSDLEIGQYIELINVKYTSSGGSPGSGSNGSNGGGGPGPGGGGNDNNDSNGGGDNEVDDWEDIYVYFPFPAFSAKVISLNSSNNSLVAETVATPKKRFNVSATSETIFVDLDSSTANNIITFNSIEVGFTVDVFSQEDPSENTELTAKGIFIKEK